MPLSELSVSTQNYLKEIWGLKMDQNPATASALAERACAFLRYLTALSAWPPPI